MPPASFFELLCLYSNSCHLILTLLLRIILFFPFALLYVIPIFETHLQTEKIELEATVVDETKERESYCGGNRRYSG